MKVCVVGCGAVGSLFAAHLAKAGEVEVWAYDLWKEHTDAIQKNGLRLSGAADFTARLNATSDPTALPRCDYGIVATKAIHTETPSRRWRTSSMTTVRCVRCRTAWATKKSSPST